MKNSRTKVQHLRKFAAMVLFCMQSACAVPMQDSLECVLPSGDKFELIAKYDYEPLSIVLKHIGHVAQRLNQEDYDVFFRPKNGEKWKESVGRVNRSSGDQLSKESGRLEICSSMGFKSGVYTVERNLLNIHDKSWSRFTKSNEDSIQIDNQLNKLIEKDFNLGWMPGFFGKEGNTLLRETPIVDLQEGTKLAKNSFEIPIRFVQRFTSYDNGKTWVEPTVTTDSKLFKIGKSLLEQEGIAKPGKYKIGPGS
jgi:hypothetical protein